MELHTGLHKYMQMNVRKVNLQINVSVNTKKHLSCKLVLALNVGNLSSVHRSQREQYLFCRINQLINVVKLRHF